MDICLLELNIIFSSGVYIGDKASISNIEFLRRQNITNVLNCAEGKDEGNDLYLK